MSYPRQYYNHITKKYEDVVNPIHKKYDNEIKDNNNNK